MDKILYEMRLTDEILDIIENKDNLTTSDYQGAIQAVIHNALNYNK